MPVHSHRWARAFVVSVVQAIVVAMTGTSAVRAADPGEWIVDAARSRIGFIASYDGIEFEGWFERWSARIVFDPHALDRSAFDIEVDMASVDTRSRDRDAGIRSSEWFDVSSFARAHYAARKFTRLAHARYQADARFRIKGTEYPLSSTFDWTPADGDAMRLAGAVAVDRRDYQIGTGEWASDPIIGFGVRIVYDLVLRKP